jgi:hypothetical protein
MGNAYALFFVAVLIGAVLALWATLRAHAGDMAAVLSGHVVVQDAPSPSRFVRFRSGRRRAFPPIRFSISRL